MQSKALGIIETRGLVGSIVAADAMVKAANVYLMGKDIVGGGLVAVMVRGDVGAVTAAVHAAIEAMRGIGEPIAAHIIPRPHNDVQDLFQHYLAASLPAETVIENIEGHALEETTEHQELVTQQSTPKYCLSEEELATLTVKQLRKIAREQEFSTIAGREISRANKKYLIEKIVQAYRLSPAGLGKE